MGSEEVDVITTDPCTEGGSWFSSTNKKTIAKNIRILLKGPKDVKLLYRKRDSVFIIPPEVLYYELDDTQRNTLMNKLEELSGKESITRNLDDANNFIKANQELFYELYYSLFGNFPIFKSTIENFLIKTYDKQQLCNIFNYIKEEIQNRPVYERGIQLAEQRLKEKLEKEKAEKEKAEKEKKKEEDPDENNNKVIEKDNFFIIDLAKFVQNEPELLEKIEKHTSLDKTDINKLLMSSILHKKYVAEEFRYVPSVEDPLTVSQRIDLALSFGRKDRKDRKSRKYSKKSRKYSKKNRKDNKNKNIIRKKSRKIMN